MHLFTTLLDYGVVVWVVYSTSIPESCGCGGCALIKYVCILFQDTERLIVCGWV